MGLRPYRSPRRTGAATGRAGRIPRRSTVTYGKLHTKHTSYSSRSHDS